jgi:hypothetical protein
VDAQLVASRAVLSFTELEIGWSAVDWIGLAQDRYR